MGRRHSKRVGSSVMWVGIGLGSILVDVFYPFSKALHNLLHQPLFVFIFIGVAVASGIGLLANMVLRRKNV